MTGEGLLARAFHQAASWLDDTVPPTELQAYLVASIQGLEAARENSPACLPPGTAEELLLAHHFAHQAGLPLPPPGTPPPADFHALDDKVLNAWIAQLPRGRVLSADGLIQGSGVHLFALLRRTVPGDAELLNTNLEALLRHVEVRRKDCLRPVQPTNIEGAWLEKHAVAILFSQVASTRRDLRFLNAALKLNDWAYPAHRRVKPTPRFARYLLSLAEQEWALREGLG